MLPHPLFIKAIELTQLVSIDLVLFDDENRLLVGRRKNEPARGYWFVPGGRIYKNEPWKEAIKRISKDELGFEVTSTQVLGIYDHMYDTNFLEKKDMRGTLIETHYMVIAIEDKIDPSKINSSVFKDQHSDMEWMIMEDIMNRKDVHPYTKQYVISRLRNQLI